MKVFLSLTLTLAAALTITAGIRLGQDWRELEARAKALELELQARQEALDALESYVQHLDQALIRVESDMSAREWIWIMADQFRRAGIQVQFH